MTLDKPLKDPPGYQLQSHNIPSGIRHKKAFAAVNKIRNKGLLK
jgi:hypothetical protein